MLLLLSVIFIVYIARWQTKKLHWKCTRETSSKSTTGSNNLWSRICIFILLIVRISFFKSKLVLTRCSVLKNFIWKSISLRIYKIWTDWVTSKLCFTSIRTLRHPQFHKHETGGALRLEGRYSDWTLKHMWNLKK